MGHSICHRSDTEPAFRLKIMYLEIKSKWPIHLHTKYMSILCILLMTRNLYFSKSGTTELLVDLPHSLPHGRANCLAVEINLVLYWEKCSLDYWALQAYGRQYLSPKRRNTCCSPDSNTMETSTCHNSVAGHQIATIFCTCHDDTAVVPCTKFGSDHGIWVDVRVKRNFHRIWIAM